MGQSYVLQIHTGSFLNAHTDVHEIQTKIGPIIAQKKIKAVIFGWYLNQTFNSELLDYFHQMHIPCYFWLPVLSEIDQIKSSVPLTDYKGNQGGSVSVIEDESFAFLCPTHQSSYMNVCDIYEEHLSSIKFDGIFLDKIRFPSFANGYAEGFGCFCQSCQKIYLEKGIDLAYIRTCIENHDPLLLKGDYDKFGHYLFKDEKINAFYKTRAGIITDFVGRLCDYFHQKNLIVGLDIYAPFFAYHCGQDIQALSNKADFLKPMFYRFTQAPAGMQYEYDAYRQYFKDNKDFEMQPISLDSLACQVSFMKNAQCQVYPGIEINPIQDICAVNTARFKESRDFFGENFDPIVCCWNCLLMSEEIEQSL